MSSKDQVKTYRRFGKVFGLGLLGVLVLAFPAQRAFAQWTDPVPLNTNAATDSGADGLPQVATDGAGNWVVVWHSGDDLGGTIGTDVDMLVSRSTDNGTTWTASAALNTNAATDSGHDTEPAVTTDGAGNWVAVWHSGDDLGGTIGTDADILVGRSTDNGATWSATAALNTDAATDSEDADVFSDVTTDGAGNWIAVWNADTFGGTDADILVSRSTDNGATWTAPAVLNTNAATDSGLDYGPKVTTDGAGNWVVVWRSNEDLGGTIGDDYDILFARSTDNGATWTPPVALNTNAATDTGFDGWPRVAADGAGNWIAVWRSYDSLAGTIGTDADSLVSRSTDNGATWTAPAALYTNAATDTGADYDPWVATDGAGNWVAVWPSSENLGGTIGTDSDIFVSRSTDNGATWTDPAALNTNAATDSGSDHGAQVTTDGACHWVAVWFSTENLGGTIGTDEDILVSISQIGGADDWDSDGLLNEVETNTGVYIDETDTGTDFNDPDTDNDGLRDGDEVRDLDPDLGGIQNPFDPVDGDSTGDDYQDTGDGVPDGQNDYDGDGMINKDEFTFGYDPLDPDSWAVLPLAALPVALVLLAVGLAVTRRARGKGLLGKKGRTLGTDV